MLAYLRKGETFAGFDVGTATAWRYVTETVALLAARSPKLRDALAQATDAGYTYVMIVGSLGGISGEYPRSKTFLNAVTIQYAQELAGTSILISNAFPGYVATDLNNSSGTSTPEQGATVAIRLTTLPDDGPTGQQFDTDGPVPW